jgi:hypothetical protein
MEDPPPLVVVLINFFQLGPNDGFRQSQPEMYDYVQSSYRTAGRWRSYLLLGRNDLVGNAS